MKPSLLALVVLLYSATATRAAVYISEFMADNAKTLKDEEGEYSDWIEIFNAGPARQDMTNWALTDDPANLTKWRFPKITLLTNDYAVVFASGKDRTNALSNLHTNFKLKKSGNYLALVDSQTNIVSEFAPQYPAQREDVSYGRDRFIPEISG